MSWRETFRSVADAADRGTRAEARSVLHLLAGLGIVVGVLAVLALVVAGVVGLAGMSTHALVVGIALLLIARECSAWLGAADDREERQERERVRERLRG